MRVKDGVLYEVSENDLQGDGTLILPAGVNSIGKRTFEYCWSLTAITLPPGLSSIGKSAFNKCWYLTTIALPEGLTSIGEWAFYDCKGLTALILPPRLTSIGECAFYDCKSLTEITLPPGLTSIGKHTFHGCKGLTAITLPPVLTSIGEWAFCGCKGLTEITLPRGLRSIDNGIFKDCTGLTRITLPSGLSSIGKWAFQNCTGLTEITLPQGLTSIGERAFEACTGLTEITLAEGLTLIDKWAFVGCNNIKQVIINTDDLENYNRIKALLLERLRTKVPSFDLFVKCKKIKSQCLQQLINQPETNFLYQELLLAGNYNHFLNALPLEIMAEINSHMKSDNWYYAKAQIKLDALLIPDSEQGLEEYRKVCQTIVAKYRDSANKCAVGFADKGAMHRKQIIGFFTTNQQENLEPKDDSPEEKNHPLFS